jgi:hypothetical protein
VGGVTLVEVDKCRAWRRMTMQYVRGCEAQSRTLLNRCCWGVVVEILQSQHTHLARGRRRRTLSACTSPSPRTLTRRSEQREPTTTATRLNPTHRCSPAVAMKSRDGKRRDNRIVERITKRRAANQIFY